jgi:hypothetical protein
MRHQVQMAVHSLAICSSLLAIREPQWRTQSAAHADRMRSLLSPGFIDEAETRRRGIHAATPLDGWRALDPEHPVYNFLLEYYALKGAKSMRRLGRWSPALSHGGVLLEGAGQTEFENGCLSPRGATLVPEGVVYDAREFKRTATREQCAAFLWYRDVLAATSEATPILHCYGLHEWAMQYWPEGSAPPPSAIYQSHLPLRVSREQINAAVERSGVSCTHVDALRYFAPSAALLNKHGAHLVRAQQPLLEQPACVHASMDLLKMALKLHPWLPSELVGDCLEVAIAARTLDVSASPYDLTRYDLAPVCIETETGSLEFRRRQLELMARAQPVRARLLLAYDAFLDAGFPAEVVEAALATPNAVHVATATPGGPAWRWSDLDARAHTSHITNELGSE